eukprot:3015740-Amphidinium_carterae.1
MVKALAAAKAGLPVTCYHMSKMAARKIVHKCRHSMHAHRANGKCPGKSVVESTVVVVGELWQGETKMH